MRFSRFFAGCLAALTMFAAAVSHGESLPGKATVVAPSDGATSVSTTRTYIQWTNAPNASGYNIYFGVNNPPRFFRECQPETTYLPSNTVYGVLPSFNLLPNTTYYWRIDERNMTGTTQGDVWSFTTGPDATPPSPNPSRWLVPPHRAGVSAISMTAVTASDADGVEYQFTCLSPGGHTSGWLTTSTYVDTGLAAETSYLYSVRTRDRSSYHNTGLPSETAGWYMSATNSPPSVTSVTTPPGTQTGLVYFNYYLRDENIDFCSIAPMYSVDNGFTWHPATPASSGDGIDNLTSSVNGVFHYFYWDSAADIPNQFFSTVRMKMIPSDYAATGTSAASGSFMIDNRPRITVPVPGSVLQSSTVAFNWTPGTDILAYKIQVTNEDGAVTFFSKAVGANLHATVNNLPTDGSRIKVVLSWQTVAYGWSEREYFYMTKPAPVQVSNINRANYRTALLQTVGSQLYIDRYYSITGGLLPTYLGQTYILTANDDKQETAEEFLSFDIDQPATVMVAIDARFSVPQAWLADWSVVPFTISTNDYAGRKLYAKTFPAGRVTLPANCYTVAPSYRSMYGVIVLPTSILQVLNVSRQAYTIDALQADKPMYTDRNYKFRDPIPLQYLNQIYMKTANNDKLQTGAQFLSFDVNQPVTVILSVDARYETMPDWMNGWMRLTGALYTTDTDRKFIAKNFPAGKVTLAGNGPNPRGWSMYNVIVVPGTLFEISNMSRSNYQLDTVAAGKRLYTDRSFTIADPIPYGYAGLPFIRTANNDKTATNSDFLSFDINRSATVIVAYDARYKTLPDWLQDWTLVQGTLCTTDTSRKFYAKTFDPGRVSLGGNRTTSTTIDYSMYSVIVMPGSVFQVSNLSRTGYMTDTLVAGKLLYIDRQFAFSDPIPAEYDGQIYIRTANNDKAQIGDDFLSFDINDAATVIVALDPRFSTPPSWLSGWMKLPQTLATTDYGVAGRKLFAKNFEAGTVTLGGNVDSELTLARSMYSVIIVPGTMFEVTNINRAGYATGFLDVGGRVYIDRTITFSSPIEPGLEGAMYIKTANNDKLVSGSEFLSFDINRPALVIVAIDGRWINPPEWLSSWGTVMVSLATSDGPRKLYAARYPAGHVTLGANLDGAQPLGYSMYSVLFLPE